MENYRLNGLHPDPYDFVYGDVFDWLRRFGRREERFDLVILDPPGFARARGRPFSAERDYDRLVELAAPVVSPGGTLIACCNVASLSRRAFRDQVLRGLHRAGRGARLIGSFHEPAVDFPTPPGQAPYLKVLVYQLDP